MLFYYNYPLKIVQKNVYNTFKSYNLKSFFFFYPFIAFFFLVNSAKWNLYYKSLDHTFFVDSIFYKINRIYTSIFKNDLDKMINYFNDNIITFFSKSIDNYIFLLENFAMNGISLIFCYFYNCFITVELSYTLDDTFTFIENEFQFSKDLLFNFLKVNNCNKYNNNLIIKLLLHYIYEIRCFFLLEIYNWILLQSLCKTEL